MWAQLITTRLKPGKEDQLPTLVKLLSDTEQPNSGLVRSTTMVDQNDPSRVYVMVVFESQEKARERENDPARANALEGARTLMGEIFERGMEFVDLTVVGETTP